VSRVKSIFLGSISSQVYGVLALLISMFTTPYILHVLNKEEYGLITIALQLVNYLSLFDFGLGAAVGRKLAIYRDESDESKATINKIISTAFITYSIIGALIIIIGISFSHKIPELFHMDPKLNNVSINIVLTLSIYLGLQFPIRALGSILYAHQRLLLANTMGLGTTIINLLLPVFLLYSGFGLWSFAYTYIISSIITILATIYMVRKLYSYIKVRIKYFDKILLSDLFHFGFFIFLNSIAIEVIFYTDRFFTGTLVSLSLVAIFSITSKAAEISRELIWKIAANAYPAMVEVSMKEGENKLKKIHNQLLTVVASFTTCAFWLILILNYQFIKLWVGSSFFTGNTILFLVLGLMVRHTILNVSITILNGAGLVKGFSIISVIEAALNIVLTLYLGRIYGLIGILIATIIAGVLTSVWYIPYTTMQYLKISLIQYLKLIFGPFILISLFGVVAYWISVYFFENIELKWLNFLSWALLLFLIFAAFTWLTFLRKIFSPYVSGRLKKYLLIR
jgi:O-antigen/teichoic acid export membrane protein